MTENKTFQQTTCYRTWLFYKEL